MVPPPGGGAACRDRLILKCERAALAGSPIRNPKITSLCRKSLPKQLSELQAEKLRRLYSFCRATAYAIASLAFAGGPR